MKWVCAFSAPSFCAVERVFRRIYGQDRVYISEERGLISYQGKILKNVRIRGRGNRFRLEVLEK